MAFDVAAGLSEMGKSVAATAGAWTLEAQKAELDKEKAKFADELAGTREEKQRGFLTAEREAGQTFQSTEKGLDRASHEKISEATRQATLTAASISAGASMSNARLAADVHREGLTPAEVRTAQWFAKATPEERTAFQEVLLAKLPPVKPPEGYRRTADGKLEFIPGGPGDPAVIKQASEAKGKDAPAGYRSTGDGKLEFIEGGPADPSIVKKASPMNNEQARDAGFADRMLNSGKLLGELDKQGTSAWGRLAESAGKGGNYAQSEDYQKFRQAKEDFINAQLRRESGAAISADEFTKADRQYFPQPGDGAEVIAQKEKNRKLVVEAMVRGAGPSYKPSASVDEPPRATAPSPAAPAALPPSEKRVIGRSYQTPTGSYIWMGNGWAKPPEAK